MLKLLLALVILWSMYVEQRHNFIYFFKFFAPRLCGFDAVLDFFYFSATVSNAPGSGQVVLVMRPGGAVTTARRRSATCRQLRGPAAL